MRKQLFNSIEKLATHDMGLVQVQAEPVSIRLPGYLVQAFVYKRADGMWSVTERNSGAMLAQYSQRKYALQVATDRCIAAGAERTQENIAAAMRYTCRHGITDGQPINPATTIDYTPRG